MQNCEIFKWDCYLVLKGFACLCDNLEMPYSTTIINYWNLLNYPLHTILCRGRSRGRVQGGHTPPPPWDDLRFSDTTGILWEKKTMWFIGVEVEQETSAPPPKKKSWIHPHFVISNQIPMARCTAKAALLTVRDQMCKLCAATTPSMLSSDILTELYLMSFGVPNHKEKWNNVNKIAIIDNSDELKFCLLSKNIPY